MHPFLRYFADIGQGLTSVATTMGAGLRTFFEKNCTLQYPDERWTLPPRSRMRLHNKLEDCIGCMRCARACPVECIKLESLKAPKATDLGTTTKGTRKKLYLTRYDIDLARCCYCGLCTTVCPEQCLVMTGNYEFAVHDRSELLFQFSKMTEEQIAEARKARQAELQARKVEQEAQKKAEAEKAGEAEPPVEGSSEKT